ncbi:MAG: RNA polymerase sigma factor [Pseudobutyrivibrio sp.]|nr:RNA polymerase sigma factor [Pseudobutyrivibrio sp.]
MDEKEVRRIVETYSDMILRISYNYLQHTFDAEDICQTVLLKFITNGIAFETKEHEKSWIIRTTINACHDLRRSAFFKRTVGLDAVAEKEAPAMPTSELLDEIKKLPLNYRISIYLHYYEGYSVKEISAVMGKPISAVSKYLSRGRQELKKSLTRDNAISIKAGELYE